MGIKHDTYLFKFGACKIIMNWAGGIEIEIIWLSVTLTLIWFNWFKLN